MRHRDPPYHAAQADESLREAYCQTLLAAHPHPAVHAILYEGVPEVAAMLERIRRQWLAPQSDTTNFIAYTNFFWDNAGKGERTTIVITPQGFRLPERQLRESIVGHEYQHAADYHDGISIGGGVVIDRTNAGELRWALRKTLLETRAYSNEILHKLDSIAAGKNDPMVNGAATVLCDYIDYLKSGIEHPTPLENRVRLYCTKTIFMTFNMTECFGTQASRKRHK